MHVENMVSGIRNFLYDIRAGSYRMADINTQSKPWVHVPYKPESIAWTRIIFVFGAMIMNGNLYIIFLNEFFDSL